MRGYRTFRIRMPAPQVGRLRVNRSIKAPKGSASGGATSDSTKKRQATPQLEGTFRSATVAAELPRSVAQKRQHVSFMVAGRARAGVLVVGYGAHR